jgi:hypothetical protein
LRNLGILIVGDNQSCDYLVAPHLFRSVKFLKALASGPEILSTSFLDTALETGEVPDPDDFLLKDPENERKLGVRLDKAIGRARANRGKLLHNVAIYCTDGVQNGPDRFKAVAEANGAIFKLYRARSGTTIRPTTAEEDGGAPPDPVYLLSSSGPQDRLLWPKFKEMAEAGHMEPRIVHPDWLVDVATRQEVFFEESYLTENRDD